jgi:signal transduction histidine kinase
MIEIASEEHDLRTMLRQVAELVVSAADGDACFVHVVGRHGTELVLRGATPEDFEHVVDTIRLPLGEGIAGWVAQHGETVVVEDKWSDPRYKYIPELRGEEFSSMVSVPLIRPKGVVVGCLNVHARGARHFDDETVARLEEAAQLLAGIVEAAVLHDRLVHREDQLEQFTIRTIEMQELDRRRIAGDIHDGISQRLVSAWYHLRAARSLSTDEPLREELTAVETLLSDALDEARRAIVGLRPQVLDDLGLTAAITSLASDLGDLEVVLDLEECDLPAHVETSFYRLTQEALQNITKHARASRVDLGLRSSAEGVQLSIQDDGVGFDAEEAAGPLSYGLVGMQERAGLLGATLTVRSAVGAGTTVTVDLPRTSAG